MGKKLDSVRKTSKEGTDSFNKAGDMGQKAVTDVKRMKSLIDSLPSDVDDEITDAAKAVSEGTKSDAEEHMRSEVGSQLETGRKSMEASTKEASDQIKSNEQVSKTFAQMDSVGAFGKAARDQGRSAIEGSISDFRDMISDNEANEKSAEDAFNKSLSDISSTF